jgi:hypothetical protein
MRRIKLWLLWIWGKLVTPSEVEQAFILCNKQLKELLQPAFPIEITETMAYLIMNQFIRDEGEEQFLNTVRLLVEQIKSNKSTEFTLAMLQKRIRDWLLHDKEKLAKLVIEALEISTVKGIPSF